MIVLSGASASGKTEVAKLLASKYGIVKVTTTTTRPVRINEVDGRDYFFVSKETFQKMIEEDHFVEHTLYNNNYYGSTKDQVSINKCIVIDLEGLKAYIALDNPAIVTFFLEASEDTRGKRMAFRGDKEEDIRRRIVNDRVVFSKENTPHVDFIIDSEEPSVEEVAQKIYEIYIEEIKRRQSLIK